MIEPSSLLDEAMGFIAEHWKPIAVFAVLLLLGVVAVLNEARSELKTVEQQATEESTKGIVGSFIEVGEQSAKTIDDPAVSGIVIFLWGFLGLMIVLMITLVIAKAFGPIIEALNPWNIAKGIAGV